MLYIIFAQFLPFCTLSFQFLLEILRNGDLYSNQIQWIHSLSMNCAFVIIAKKALLAPRP